MFLYAGRGAVHELQIGDIGLRLGRPYTASFRMQNKDMQEGLPFFCTITLELLPGQGEN